MDFILSIVFAIIPALISLFISKLIDKKIDNISNKIQNNSFFLIVYYIIAFIALMGVFSSFFIYSQIKEQYFSNAIILILISSISDVIIFTFEEINS